MPVTNNTGSTLLSTLRCLWLFPLAYLLHAIEEYRGVGALHGINLSPTEFLVLSSAAWLLMLTGIVLSERYRFPQLFGVCLGTVFLLNGISHILNCIVIRGYDAGAISGTVILIPLGTAILISSRNKMNRQRYGAGIALGTVIQGIATIIAL